MKPQRQVGAAKEAKEVKRRPSFEIAQDYVELNLVPIIEADAEAGLSKRQLRRKRKTEAKKLKQRQHHYLRNSIIFAIVLVVLAVGTAALWWSSSSEPVNAADKNTRQFMVDQGATTDQIADALQRSGFIRNQLAFKLQIRLSGGIIQAGTHMLSPSYNLNDIVARLAKADTDEVDVQIAPGRTLSEIKEDLKKYDYTEAEIDNALNANYTQSILADRPAGATLEGYIYPDTYRVLAGDSAQVVINKALNQLEKVAKDNNLQAGFAAHGLTFYQGLTLASVVAMENKNVNDQKMVAGVFYNRMAAGMPLGSDVTFKYAYKMGLCANNVNGPDCDSSYNTRIHTGLMPGPIANPGLTALQAVANPTTSNYYYFVAGDDGKNYYAETMDQHSQNIASHCTKLCQ